ncbi:MAG: entericidin EcnA/B family protein [Lachnospiraceae bacterium]|nr:entericidin EcnA/B family protein [Lachnospiraceae bacterium]
MKTKKILLTGIVTVFFVTGCGTTKRETNNITSENPTETTAAAPDKLYTPEELTTLVDDFVSRIDSITPGNDDSQNLEQYFSLKQEEKQLDHALERYEDNLENQYRAGTLTKEKYKNLEQKLEKLEDQLDDAEDQLEISFGIDD